MSTQNAAPTMKDVAREAGVALGTVSKVVNGIPVGDSYRQRVEEAIERLNYRVNSYAKGLRSSKSFLVAVMVPNLVNPFFARLVNCIDRSLTARKYKMLLFATDYDPQQEQEYVYLAEQQKVDGIICLSYNSQLIVPASVPLVSIDRCFSTNVPCVSSDNYGGGRLAAEKLVENGCRNLAFLRIGTLKILDDGSPYTDFEDFLREHLHDGKLDFDGIFCVTDSLAYQIVNSLRGMGLRVPEDVQIIGFDGVRSFGDLEFYCSTIVQPLEDIAETCVDMVVERRWEKTPSMVCLPVSYAYGGTTRQ